MYRPRQRTVGGYVMKELLRRKLPPMTSLRGFEAAARHMSFSDAATEMQLTQGAVSRQIRALEGYLNLPLFVRKTRRVVLTPAGSELFPVVRDVLDQIERTTSQLKKKSKSKTLVISVLPTLASTWIMPRLHMFTESRNHLDLRIVTSIEPVDLANERIDVALRVGRLPGHCYDKARPRIELEMVANWDGITADELFADTLVPICSPALLQGRTIRRANELLAYPLIHTSSRRHAWPDWLRAHRVVSSEKRKLEFGHFFMSMEAALRGQGIAIVPEVLLSLHKDAHRLTRIFGPSISSAGGYYLLTHESKAKSREVQSLRKWILSESEALRKPAQ
jgi:LysR family transcriptional regulator, glycine cleavage system transcriptional activator